MLGISHDVLLVLCSLSIVMVFGVVLGKPLNTTHEKSLTRPPVQDFIGNKDLDDDDDYPETAMPEESGEVTEDDTADLVEQFLDGDIDQGDNGGCAHVPGEHTTAGAGHPLPSVLALFLSNYLLIMQLEL